MEKDHHSLNDIQSAQKIFSLLCNNNIDLDQDKKDCASGKQWKKSLIVFGAAKLY